MVPLPGNRSSLVCVVEPARGRAHRRARRGRALRRARTALPFDARQDRGRARPRPISARGETARSFGAKRIALVGEAAHRFRRSARRGSISVCATPRRSPRWRSSASRRRGFGAPDVLARYETMRRADVMSRTFAVDLLNRSLLSDFLPVQGVRGLGLHLLDSVGPLRRAVMREGVTPAASQPRLMRGEALTARRASGLGAGSGFRPRRGIADAIGTGNAGSVAAGHAAIRVARTDRAPMKCGSRSASSSERDDRSRSNPPSQRPAASAPLFRLNDAGHRRHRSPPDRARSSAKSARARSRANAARTYPPAPRRRPAGRPSSDRAGSAASRRRERPRRRPETCRWRAPIASACHAKVNIASVIAMSRWQPCPVTSRCRSARRILITAGKRAAARCRRSSAGGTTGRSDGPGCERRAGRSRRCS